MSQLDRRLVFATFLWGVAIAISMGALLRYKVTPGAAAAIEVNRWPTDTAQTLDPKFPTLLLFAHPRCACSRATLNELNRILQEFPEGVHATVLLVEHVTSSDVAWNDVDLVTQASKIPGLTLRTDREAAEAKRFGALTSGHVLLFRPDGTRVFSGGITGMRGHEGPNIGLTRLRAALNGSQPDSNHSPVFGCDLGTDADHTDHSHHSQIREDPKA